VFVPGVDNFERLQWRQGVKCMRGQGDSCVAEEIGPNRLSLWQMQWMERLNGRVDDDWRRRKKRYKLLDGPYLRRSPLKSHATPLFRD